MFDWDEYFHLSGLTLNAGPKMEEADDKADDYKLKSPSEFFKFPCASMQNWLMQLSKKGSLLIKTNAY